MKILMCTDGSGFAEDAIRFSGRIAQAMGWDISILYVRPRASSEHRIHLTTARKKLNEWNLDIPGVSYLKRAKEILMETDAAKILPAVETELKQTFREGVYGATEIHLDGIHGENVRLRLREGETIDEILEEAKGGNYDLIVTGSRGHKGIARYFIGSIEMSVAKHAPCSVLIAKNIKGHEDFLITTDGSEMAERAEIFIAPIARALDARVTILSIAEEGIDEVKAIERARRAEMIVSQMGLTSDIKVGIGRPAEEIIEEARNHDLVVLSASGSSGVKTFFMGSVPLKVIEYGETPVLIVR
ncbi:MAG: universal stress protein [Nitrospirota bacterium]